MTKIITILFITGIFCIFIGLSIFIYSILKYPKRKQKIFSIMNKEEVMKYNQISKIKREKRSEQEQEFYFKNKQLYIATTGSKWFKIGYIFIFLAITGWIYYYVI
ncbi:hypothetical protein CBLAS_0784 [Campylobacter blaseri]|uniref:Uncharacterized protein n=1 Tax=Campylobacter blaseri TaxID=2042961 RepID=A0A2P8R2E7_9BACT|nr:hypothetical protein [Campylobacter blaseri]PSM52673.1 hypothetical protein CQ405_02775 [Campylobacter blaseri]PSM54321.1 hypothetical protein CRN67_02775 [Campylobacter blaseri]QKF85973.1 hypothetical protein CBLAS_0784 [Campylobacter blaseri]